MENLKKIREENCLTQGEVADAVNVSRSTVAMWEAGKALPRSETLIKLADLFHCTIDELFARDTPGRDSA